MNHANQTAVEPGSQQTITARMEANVDTVVRIQSLAASVRVRALGYCHDGASPPSTVAGSCAIAAPEPGSPPLADLAIECGNRLSDIECVLMETLQRL